MRTIIVTRPENIRIRLFIEIATTTMSFFGLGRYTLRDILCDPSSAAFAHKQSSRPVSPGRWIHRRNLYGRKHGRGRIISGVLIPADGNIIRTGQRGWGFELGRFCLRYYETSLWASPTTTRIVLLDNNTQIERARTQLCRAVKLSSEKKKPTSSNVCEIVLKHLFIFFKTYYNIQTVTRGTR